MRLSEMNPLNRTLFWVFLFLVVINLSVLISFFVLVNRQEKALNTETRDITAGIIRNELDLTETQIPRLCSIQDSFRNHAQPLALAIREKRNEILDHLYSDEPDTLVLNTLVTELTQMQIQLQKANIDHYLQVKSLCNPHQKDKLHKMYCRIYGCREKEHGRQERHRQGWRE